MAPDRVVDAAGMRHAVTVEGSGPTVVLLHAGVADRRMWDAVAARLSTDRRVVRPDLRGFGDTLPGEGAFSHERDVLAVLDALEVDRATLVGTSFGGLVALGTATEAPERFARLVLLSPPLPDHAWSARMTEFFAAEEAAIEAGDLDHAVALNVALWAAELDDDGRALVAAMQRRAFELQLDAATEEQELDPPVAERLRRLQLPVDVLVGDRDVADFRAIAERLGRELPDARVRVLPGLGHLAAVQDPDAVAAAIRTASA